MKVLRFPDENPTSGSSTDVTATGATAAATTTANAGQTATSATEKAPSLQEAVQAHLKSQDASASSTEEKGEEESGSENEQDSQQNAEAGKEEGQQEKGTEKEEGSQEQGKEGETEKGPVPYTRFEEVAKERDQYKQQVEQTQGAVQAYQEIHAFCQEHSITNEQFQSAVRIQALLNTNPAEALKQLMPIVESLQGFTGDKLPEDLQKAVDEGHVNLQYAKEIANARAMSKFGEVKVKHDQKILEQKQQAAVQQAVSEAVTTWESKKRETDPDYKPKANANSPDGKWEDVRDKFLAMLHQTDAQGQPVNKITSVHDYTGLLEKAYQAIHKRVTVKPPTRKTPSSNGSSITTNSTKRIEDAKSLQEAVNIALNGK